MPRARVFSRPQRAVEIWRRKILGELEGLPQQQEGSWIGRGLINLQAGLWLHLLLVCFPPAAAAFEQGWVPTGAQGPFHIISMSLGEV